MQPAKKNHFLSWPPMSPAGHLSPLPSPSWLFDATCGKGGGPQQASVPTWVPVSPCAATAGTGQLPRSEVHKGRLGPSRPALAWSQVMATAHHARGGRA